MSNKEDIKNVITTTIIATLKEENFKLAAKNIFKSELKSILISDKEEFFQGKVYKNLEKSLHIKIKEFAKSSELKNSLSEIFHKKLQHIENSNYTFSMIIPTTFTNSLKVYVYNNKDIIAATIKTTLNSNKVKAKMKEEISKAIGSLNPMASKFINSDKIFYKISTSINSYFDNPETIMDIVMMINGLLDNLMKKNVSEFSMYMPIEGKNSLVESLSNVIINNLFSDEIINKGTQKLREKLNDKAFINKLFNDNQHSFDNIIDDLSHKFYNTILENSELKGIVDNVSDILVDKLLEMPLKDFI